jgi:hypothetical protein
MKNSVLMRSINTLYFRQNNSLILKLTSGQRKNNIKYRYYSHIPISPNIRKTKSLLYYVDTYTAAL